MRGESETYLDMVVRANNEAFCERRLAEWFVHAGAHQERIHRVIVLPSEPVRRQLVERVKRLSLVS